MSQEGIQSKHCSISKFVLDTIDWKKSKPYRRRIVWADWATTVTKERMITTTRIILKEEEEAEDLIPTSQGHAMCVMVVHIGRLNVGYSIIRMEIMRTNLLNTHLKEPYGRRKGTIDYPII
jgi:hypothetical protein